MTIDKTIYYAYIECELERGARSQHSLKKQEINPFHSHHYTHSHMSLMLHLSLQPVDFESSALEFTSSIDIGYSIHEFFQRLIEGPFLRARTRHKEPYHTLKTFYVLVKILDSLKNWYVLVPCPTLWSFLGKQVVPQSPTSVKKSPNDVFFNCFP